MPFQIDWDKPFEPAYGIVTLPGDYVFYRGYSTAHPPVSDRPAYYSALGIAIEYAKPRGYTLAAFSTKRPLRILDIRYMKHLLRDLFEENPKDSSSLSVILSFGLCSLQKQIQLAELRFSSGALKREIDALKASLQVDALFEQPGVRIAETTNDAETMGFLKAIFYGVVDGFLAPPLVTPFHVEKHGCMIPELILFDPLHAGIQCLDTIPTDLPKVPVSMLYQMTFGTFIYRKINSYGLLHGYMHGGAVAAYTSTYVFDDLQDAWDTLDVQNAFEKGYIAGNTWKSTWSFSSATHAAPASSTATWFPQAFPWNAVVQKVATMRTNTTRKRRRGVGR